MVIIRNIILSEGYNFGFAILSEISVILLNKAVDLRDSNTHFPKKPKQVFSP
jgi:hypothetical protein